MNYKAQKSGSKGDYGSQSATKTSGSTTSGGRGAGGASKTVGDAAANRKTYGPQKSGSKGG